MQANKGGENRTLKRITEKLDGFGEELMQLRNTREGEDERVKGVYAFFGDATKGVLGRDVNKVLELAEKHQKDMWLELTEMEKEENPGLKPPYMLSLPLRFNPPVVDLGTGNEVVFGFHPRQNFFTNVRSDGSVSDTYMVFTPTAEAKDHPTIKAIASYPDINAESLREALNRSLSQFEKDMDDRMNRFRRIRGIERTQ